MKKRKLPLIKHPPKNYSLSKKAITKAGRYFDPNCGGTPSTDLDLLYPVFFLLHALALYPQEYLSAEWLRIIKTCELVLTSEVNKNYFSFNYWIRNQTRNEEGELRKLPDDIDDTANAIAALYQAFTKGFTQKEPDKRFLVGMIPLKVAPGGPYISWYVPRSDEYKEWHDVDPVVNANVAYMASLYGVVLEGNYNHLIESLESESYKSPYYPSPLTFHYYCARFVKQLKKIDQPRYRKLRKLLLLSGNKERRSELFDQLEINQILWNLIKIYLGIAPDAKELEDINKMVKLPLAICVDFAIKGKGMSYAGSRIVTLAMCLELEALQLSSNNHKKKRNKLTNPEKVVQGLMSELKISDKVAPYIDDSKVISILNVLSKNFFPNVDLRNQELRSKMRYLELNWLYFGLYDRQIDGQGTNKNLLARIEMAIQSELILLNRCIETPKEFNRFILGQIEAAYEFYSWEKNNLRFSSSIALTDFLLLVDNKQQLLAQGKQNYIRNRMRPFIKTCLKLFVKDAEVPYLEETLLKLLELQQVNDDLHDWKEDLASGRFTTANIEFLQKVAQLDDESNQEIFAELTQILSRRGKIMKSTKSNHPNLDKVFWGKFMPGYLDLQEKKYGKLLKKIDLIEKSLNAKAFSLLKNFAEDSYTPFAKAKKSITESTHIMNFLRNSQTD